jgi:serine/threonine-protein kinase
MYRVLNEMPPSPADLNPSIPVAFDYIIARALAKAPENRYQSAREMANDLRNFKKLTTTSPLASTSSSGKIPAADGDATVRLNANQIPAAPGRGGGKKRAAFVAAAILVAATGLFITASRESALTAVDLNKPTTPQTAAIAVKPPLPAETESKVPEEQLRITAPAKAPDDQPSIVAPTKATLGFAILPWGEIFIDDKSQGASPPLREIKLAPGKHRIEIKNTEFPPYRQTVELEAGASKTIRHKFK